MLDISVTIEGDKVIIEGLDRFAKEIPQAIQRGLDRVGTGIYREAFAFLSGAGAKGTSSEKVNKKTGKTYLKWEKQSVSAGGYPVPVRTGNLRGHLNLLLHGQTKADEYKSFTAGPFENIIYDSVPYSVVIHEGTHSSAKFGPRRFLTDALAKFNQGDRIKAILEEEIGKAIGK